LIRDRAFAGNLATVPNDEADDATEDPPTAASAGDPEPTKSTEPTRTTEPADAPAVESPVVEVTGLRMTISDQRRSGRRWSLRRPSEPITVADDISFTIAAGEAVGYVGAAGAGKSTLVDLISGWSTPTGGTIRACGLAPVAERAQLAHRIGVVSGRHSQLWPNLSLDDALRILAGVHHLPEARRPARRAELIDRLDLGAFVALPVGQLSPGRRVRSELAAALLHEPDLLILDEPTIGLDVVSKEHLRTFLRQENRLHGRTLLLATGDLADVEQICHRVLVIDHGRLVHDGDLPGLISRAGAQRTLVVDLVEAGRLDDVPGAKLIGVEAGGLRQRLHFTPGNIPAARILADVAARSGIRHLTLEEPDLNDLIRRL
jgi:ABC-2 type transport system ATP-binding protein